MYYGISVLTMDTSYMKYIKWNKILNMNGLSYISVPYFNLN